MNMGGQTQSRKPFVDMVDRMLQKRGLSQEQFADQIGRASKTRLGESEENIPGGYREAKLKQFTPEQMQLFQQLIQQIGPESFLARLAQGDESLFDEMEAPAMRRFNELQGNIASRFSSMGRGGTRSSGFKNTINQAGSDFAQDLASRRGELQRQAMLDLQGMGRELLGQRPYEKALVKKDYPQQQQDQSGDFLSGIFNGLAGGAAGFATGGVPGAVAGGASGFYKGYNGVR